MQEKNICFFPNLEKKGIDAPPKVMWAVDDEVRAEIKSLQQQLSNINLDEVKIKKDMNAVILKN